MTFTIDELSIPDDLEDDSAADFLEMVRVRNEVEVGMLGSDVLQMTPEALAPLFRDNATRRQRHFVARVNGRIVGRARLAWKTRVDAPAAGLTIDVLGSHRQRGIGQALLDTLESAAIDLGRRVLQTDQGHTALSGGERVPSPTGFGSLPAADPGVRFLVRNGYALEMVARVSSLTVDSGLDAIREHRRSAEMHAGPDYGVVAWSGATPDGLLDDMAVLKTRMSTDAPMAGMETVEDVWDTDRVRANDERERRGGRDRFTAAAQHAPSGRLVGYTELTLPQGGGAYAIQEDTLVLREHRGHRLGMLVKAANLLELAQHHPGTLVTTFNAEDNRPMLDVNEALGFAGIGLEGNWQKRI